MQHNKSCNYKGCRISCECVDELTHKTLKFTRKKPKKSLEEPAKEFRLIGLITSLDFQKSRYILTKLNKYYPKKYKIDIRPMLDVEWNQCILNLRRESGSGSPLWETRNDVIMFCDGKFFGDYRALQEYVQKKYRFAFHEQWYCVASKHLMEYLTEKTERYRQLVYLTVAIQDEVVGSLLFELFNDVVPLTCENFFKRCTSEEEANGYVGVPIHRSVVNSWIQFGGFELLETPMPEENFVISHDRRGILSMCNSKKHTDNTTQFFIALDAAPWMDNKYVAFGVLIQGDSTLKKIENVHAHYQQPEWEMQIVKTGEFLTTWRPDSEKLYSVEDIDNHVEPPGASVDSFPRPPQTETSDQQQTEQTESDEDSTESDSTTLSGSLLEETGSALEDDQATLSTMDQRTSGPSVISLPDYLAQVGQDGEGFITPQDYIPGGYGYEPEKYPQQFYEIIGE